MMLVKKERQKSSEERTYRNELKYVCSDGELIQIKERIKPLCKSDPHVGKDGRYKIRSIYFDDEDDSCFYGNENGTDPREKFRIRIYDDNFSTIFFECKGKENGMTYKEHTLITEKVCRDMLEGKFSVDRERDRLLLKFFLQYRGKRLYPKAIVAYERTPFIYSAGNVRITLDRNIGAGIKISDFFESYIPVRPVMPQGKHILEVKYDSFLPDFLYRIMNLGDLRQTAYSKYYYCRKFTM